MITGVSSGFGRALAIAALALGDKVAGTVRTEEAREAFAELAPGRSFGMLLDVTDEAAVHATVSAIEASSEGIDILVNNAGYGLVGGVEEASMAEIRAQFEVNVFGAVAVMQAVLPFMRARRAGRILNITSVSGLVGWPSLGIYSGSKFALEGICETLAMEVEPLGIKVTMIEPGGFRTEFAQGSRAQTARIIDDYDGTVGQSRRILAGHAGREIGDPAKAAQAILTVASQASPPLRLLLGADAIGYTTHKLAKQSAEIAAWEALSVSTDFPAS
ncbi:MAG: short-chain dehydrogenase/reductase [Rhodospirillales bacterium]|nr:short-chain dehydrogenase/reductase [Rhodospirillales bacterium]